MKHSDEFGYYYIRETKGNYKMCFIENKHDMSAA